ncbi:MAG: hypothetical protein V3574_01430 [Candidatus Moraniibacteriota bacterium]
MRYTRIFLSSILLLAGTVLLSGCSQQNEVGQSQSQSDSEAEDTSTVNKQSEDERIGEVASKGELIKISEQDNEEIKEWIMKYKENKDTAFETIDIDWDYDDPTGTWFAQKELGFNTVTNPPINLEEIENEYKEYYAKSRNPLNNFRAEKIAESLFGKTKYNRKESCEKGKGSCWYPKINSSKEELENIFSAHISSLNKFINIANQYYPTRVPRSELLYAQKTNGHVLSDSKINNAMLSGFQEASPLMTSMYSSSNSSGDWPIIKRINSIIARGGSNMVYELVSLTKESENASYFSEVKYEKDSFGERTLISGQIKIKVTTFEKVDDEHVKKVTHYVDFLNKKGEESYPFLNSGDNANLELLSYGKSSSGMVEAKFGIAYQKDK